METGAPKSRNFLKVLIPVVLIVAVVWGGLQLIKSRVSGGPAGDDGQELVVGAELPDFTLNPLEGAPVQASELPGRVTMLNFWASWCEACMVEMPSIHRLWQAYKDRGFTVAAVNVDENPQAVIPRVNKQLGFSLPMYTDPQGELSSMFDVRAIPFTVIIDENRRILHLEAGERDWFSDTIRTRMEDWLKNAK